MEWYCDLEPESPAWPSSRATASPCQWPLGNSWHSERATPPPALAVNLWRIHGGYFNGEIQNESARIMCEWSTSMSPEKS